MTSVVTMNLSDSDGGMTHLPQAVIERQPDAPTTNLVYSATIVAEEKKIDTSTKQQKEMDSTPISDIMSGNEMMMMGGDHQPMQMQQDPRMAHQQMYAQPPMQIQQVQAQQPQVQAQQKSSNPGNLTDEQMQALFAGVCAVIAFSGPVQDKLSTFVPQFVTDAGNRSTVGIAVTGCIAAAVFYFGKRVVLK
jgi:hypothetical protein